MDLYWEMDCRATDTQMASLKEHLLMPADDPEHQWLGSKCLQPSSTCHQIIFAKVSSWVRFPRWTFLLPQKLPFGVAERSDLHWCWVVEHSGLHLTCVAAAPGWMVHRQTQITCWGGSTSDVRAVVAPSQRQDFGYLEAEGIQCQYWQGSISLAVEPL